MKKNVFLLLILFFLFSIPITLKAGITGTTNTTVNVRSGPTTNSQIIESLNNGSNIDIIDNVKISGLGCNDGWYKINFKDNTRYICSGQVNVSNTENTMNNLGFINVTGLSYVEFGTKVTVLGEGSYIYGCNNGTWKFKYGNNIRTTCKEYIYKYKDITTDDSDYTAILKNDGFPDTYIPYLNKLHQLHPGWTFTPKLLNINLEDAVNAESQGVFSLVQSIDSSFRADDVVREGTNWYRAHPDVIRFYLDPRNFLTEKHALMFTNNSYDKIHHTKNIIQSIFTDYLMFDMNNVKALELWSKEGGLK